MTRTLSEEPVEMRALFRPLASAIIARNTPTTRAMVNTVISELIRRTIRLRRLYFSGMPKSRSSVGSIRSNRQGRVAEDGILCRFAQDTILRHALKLVLQTPGNCPPKGGTPNSGKLPA